MDPLRIFHVVLLQWLILKLEQILHEKVASLCVSVINRSFHSLNCNAEQNKCLGSFKSITAYWNSMRWLIFCRLAYHAPRLIALLFCKTYKVGCRHSMYTLTQFVRELFHSLQQPLNWNILSHEHRLYQNLQLFVQTSCSRAQLSITRPHFSATK